MKDRREYHRQYYWQHKEHLAAIKAHRQKHDVDYRLRAVLRTIVQRCNDPRHATYKWYGGLGIKSDLTLEQLKTLWERDGAARMRKPSVDRRDVTQNYTFDNCFFNELKDNQARRRPFGTVIRNGRPVGAQSCAV